jgi:LTXXQ motif family protein
MRKFILVSASAAAIIAATFGVSAFAAAGDAPAAPSGAEMQRMQEDHAAMLEAHLAGMKAGLKLTAEQEKNWPAFEAAIRDVAKARAEGWRQMHDKMDRAERASPIEHMTVMSEHFQKISAELKTVAEASKPLYDSLSEAQKRHFGPLIHAFVEHGPHGDGHMRHAAFDGEGEHERMQ